MLSCIASNTMGFDGSSGSSEDSETLSHLLPPIDDGNWPARHPSSACAGAIHAPDAMMASMMAPAIPLVRRLLSLLTLLSVALLSPAPKSHTVLVPLFSGSNWGVAPLDRENKYGTQSSG